MNNKKDYPFTNIRLYRVSYIPIFYLLVLIPVPPHVLGAGGSPFVKPLTTRAIAAKKPLRCVHCRTSAASH
jgi:hypothetical protein